MMITNARVLTFDATNRVLDSGEVEIRPDGTIGAVQARLARHDGDEIIDAQGRLLMPALINCHTHLYSTLARGIPLRAKPRNFPEILSKLWWRLDRALNPDDIYYSALIGLIDSAKNGVGTLIDHHSSPNACAGSLDVVERAFRQVGLRGVLCYETSDRNGAKSAAEGIAENIRFIERPHAHPDGMIAACFGLHASFTLSDATLERAKEAAESLEACMHVHVAEDRCDEGAATRLCRAGILDDRALAAHCIHVSAAEIRMLARRHVNVVHNPQSNCNNAVGTARLLDLTRNKVLVGLGSDGYSPRLWEEFKTALNLQKLLARDPRVAFAEAYAAAFVNNRKIVRKLFGMDVGRIEEGAQADLILVDYYPPTPLNTGNLFGHILFGIANAPVDSLLVNGRFVLRDRRCVTVDERQAAQCAALQARSLWSRF
jgi:putative selenium metabolism protein SsnA